MHEGGAGDFRRSQCGSPGSDWYVLYAILTPAPLDFSLDLWARGESRSRKRRAVFDVSPLKSRPAANGMVAVMVGEAAAALPAGTQANVVRCTTFRADSAFVLVPIPVNGRAAARNGLADLSPPEANDRPPMKSAPKQAAPISVSLVLDLSGSLPGVLRVAREFLLDVTNDANPADEVFLYTLSAHPRAYTELTRDYSAVRKQTAIEGSRGAALIDAVREGLRGLRSGIHARKALLVISMGTEHYNRHFWDELLEFAAKSETQIYCITVCNRSAFTRRVELMSAKRGVLLLDELSILTDPIGFMVRGQVAIAKAGAAIDRALRAQYIVGYVPSGCWYDGRWRRIAVKVACSGMKAYPYSINRAG